MKNKANLAILALVAIPLSVVPQGLLAAPQAPQPSASGATVGALNVGFRDGRLSIEARDATLGTLLNAVTEHTGVPFNVSDGTLRQDRITVSIEDRPLAEAIPLMLVGYNVLHVWDEKMTPLQVNVLGRSVAGATPGASGTEGRVALNAHSAPATETSARKNHPRPAAPPDPAKIESALEDLRSQDSSRRLTALDEVVGGDDARRAGDPRRGSRRADRRPGDSVR